MKRWVICLLGWIGLLLGSADVQAQDQCGIVSTVSFPVDRASFQLAQDFGVPSLRHQGRYHTGEDYYAGRGTTLALPVRAIAEGRVTYSAPTGWGRDGGVVIIEHTFADGTVYYSQYGHIQSTDTAPFPERFTCVRAGDVIGAIGDTRPAPHLHFEIRTTGPDVPGPGYSWELPAEAGWLQPSKFVLNSQAWLHPAHRWHVQLPDDERPVSPPVFFGDGSFILAGSDRIRLISNDGRVLSRVVLENTVIGLSSLNGQPLLTFSDDLMQLINGDGTLGERWLTGIQLRQPVMTWGDLLVAPTAAGGLAAFSADRREVAWRVDDLGIIQEIAPTASLLAVRLTDGTLHLLGTDGSRSGSLRLEPGAFLKPGPNGNIITSTATTLDQIDAQGTRTVWMNTPVTPESGTLFLPDGSYYLTGGAPHTLTAYTAEGAARWQVNISELSGAITLDRLGQIVLVITQDGQVLTIQDTNALTCGRLRLYADQRTPLWHSLRDGLLRILAADQVMGLDWQALIGGCVP
jgi:murein DD-endopeptidase MepM/ murein hydrolase activator NlpD